MEKLGSQEKNNPKATKYSHQGHFPGCPEIIPGTAVCSAYIQSPPLCGFQKKQRKCFTMCLACDRPALQDYFAMSPSCQECAQLRRGISRPQCLRIAGMPTATASNQGSQSLSTGLLLVMPAAPQGGTITSKETAQANALLWLLRMFLLI